MAEITFYEKPGCINNTKQKKLLMRSGHKVKARDILKYEWDTQTLRRFFGTEPVINWFNRSAPAIRDGHVHPQLLDETRALLLMVTDPLLIRRPLMQVDQECRAGFDMEAVNRWIGLVAEDSKQDLENCPRK